MTEIFNHIYMKTYLYEENKEKLKLLKASKIKNWLN